MNFDKDYYENGIKTGKSCYENYRWLPEVTVPFAQKILMYTKMEYKHKILDFGCAKGYLVRALRQIGADAWGLDISEYAINNAPSDVKPYLMRWEYDSFHLQRFLYKNKFDWMIAKDVFEHIDQHKLKSILGKLKFYIENIFVIVPLGDKNGYFADDNNKDPSHVICENAHWWFNTFTNFGYSVVRFESRVDGMKQKYDKIENAHGFFTLKRYMK